MKRTLTTILLIGLNHSVPLLQATTYHAPVENVTLFKVDKLSIDVDTMHALAKNLMVLATREQAAQGAEQLRATAQFIAIAQRLNPEMNEITQLNEALQNNNSFLASHVDSIQKAKNDTFNLLKYLSEPAAGKEANHLSKCLKEPLALLDPNHPYLKNHHSDPLVWNDAIASLDAFKRMPEVAETPASPDSQVTLPDLPKEPTPLKTEQISWHFTHASIFSPGYIAIPAEHGYRSQLVMMEYRVTITPRKNQFNNQFNLSSQPKVVTNNNPNQETNGSDNAHHNDHLANKLQPNLNSILAARWKSFQDADIKVTLVHPYSHDNGQSGLAPLAVLLDASLAGKDIRKNLVILSEMNDKGHFHRRHHYWEYIKKLTKMEGQHRILIPKECEADFRQILVLENPEFFVNNEIIVVSDLTEAAKYYGSKDDESIHEATANFQQIQSVAANRPVGPLMTNTSVRQKLNAIIAVMPNHLSAKMLLLQSVGNRPTKLDGPYVAYELRKIISPYFSVIHKGSPSVINSQKLSGSIRAIENDLKYFERYVSSDQRDLFRDCQKLTKLLDGVARSVGKQDSKYHERKAKDSFDEAKQIHQKIMMKMTELIHKKA